MKVDRYVEPAEFDKWKQVAEDMGFLYVASGPLVRSSYKVRGLLRRGNLMLNVFDVFRLANFTSKTFSVEKRIPLAVSNLRFLRRPST